MHTRLAFNIALIVCLLFLPWWVGAIVLVSACFVVNKFYEALVYGILADSFFGTNYGFYGVTYIATLYALLAFVFASLIRKRLAW